MLRLLQGQGTVGRSRLHACSRSLPPSFVPPPSPDRPSLCSVTARRTPDCRQARLLLTRLITQPSSPGLENRAYTWYARARTYLGAPRTQFHPPSRAHRKTRPERVNSVRRWLLKPPPARSLARSPEDEKDVAVTPVVRAAAASPVGSLFCLSRVFLK